MGKSDGEGAPKNFFEVPVRTGDPPAVSDAGTQEQLTQNSPKALQERLFLFATGLRGVLVRPSVVCTPGDRAFHLSPKLARGPLSAFVAATEFAHLHPSYDGSLHLALPEGAASAGVAAGWGKPDPKTGTFLLFGPRDEMELVVAWAFLKWSYRYARNLPDLDQLVIEDITVD